MSFDVFLIPVRNGELVNFRTWDVEQVLGPYIAVRARDSLRLEFPDGGGAEVYYGDDDEDTGMMFNHFGGADFYEALYQLAARTQALLLWPAVDRPNHAITNAAAPRHLPPDYVEKCGTPVLVHDSRELMELIGW